MKITRRQLRRLIRESIQLQEDAWEDRKASLVQRDDDPSGGEGVAGPNQYPSDSDYEDLHAKGKKCYWLDGSGMLSIDVYENDCVKTPENRDRLGSNGKKLFTEWFPFVLAMKDKLRSDEDWNELYNKAHDAHEQGEEIVMNAQDVAKEAIVNRLKREYGAESYQISGAFITGGGSMSDVVSDMVYDAGRWIQKVTSG